MVSQDDSNEDEYMPLFQRIENHLRVIHHHVKHGKEVINIKAVDNGTTGKIDLSQDLRLPAKITHIVAIWDTTATTVTLTLGDRVITVPPSLGVLSLEGIWQFQPRDTIKLTLGSAKVCYLELMGYSDRRVLENG